MKEFPEKFSPHFLIPNVSLIKTLSFWANPALLRDYSCPTSGRAPNNKQVPIHPVRYDLFNGIKPISCFLSKRVNKIQNLVQRAIFFAPYQQMGFEKQIMILSGWR